MIASVGASRIRIAALIVVATSAAFSAFATFALHIEQAKARVAMTVRIVVEFNIDFVKRLKLTSPPVKNQNQKINPKPVQKMPVQRCRVN